MVARLDAHDEGKTQNRGPVKKTEKRQRTLFGKMGHFGHFSAASKRIGDLYKNLHVDFCAWRQGPNVL